MNPEEYGKKLKKLRMTLAKMMEVDGSVEVLQFLMHTCGHQALDTGEMDQLRALHIASIRKVWLRFRQLLPHHKLVQIELPLPMQGEQECQTEEQPSPEIPAHRMPQRKLGR